jgi:hypothetical protein
VKFHYHALSRSRLKDLRYGQLPRLFPKIHSKSGTILFFEVIDGIVDRLRKLPKREFAQGRRPPARRRILQRIPIPPVPPGAPRTFKPKPVGRKFFLSELRGRVKNIHQLLPILKGIYPVPVQEKDSKVGKQHRSALVPPFCPPPPPL